LKEEKLTCDFEVENSGNNLSNGQKQIINFLRILINEHEIVCLDEATSNMDPISDQLVHDKLFEFCQSKTLLVITHRLENIDKFDTIIVMD
jgi:ABC-type bacteriocin/lantibiotic exporter with double-glycine peptidase domain